MHDDWLCRLCIRCDQLGRKQTGGGRNRGQGHRRGRGRRRGSSSHVGQQAIVATVGERGLSLVGVVNGQLGRARQILGGRS